MKGAGRQGFGWGILDMVVISYTCLGVGLDYKQQNLTVQLIINIDLLGAQWLGIPKGSSER